MNRKRSPFMAAIPAFAALAVFKVWPFIVSVGTSLRDYSPKLGIGGSPFVAFKHYSDFLSSYYLPRLALNSFVLSIVSAVFTAALALVAIYALMNLKNGYLKCLFLSIFAIPAIMPTSLLVGIVKGLLTSVSLLAGMALRVGLVEEKRNLLTEPYLYTWIYASVEALRYFFIPTAAALIYAESWEAKKIYNVVLTYFVVRLAFTATMGSDLSIMLYNPMVYPTADTLSTHAFRRGLLEANYGLSSAIDVIRAISGAVIGLLGLFVLHKCLKKVEPGIEKEPAPREGGPVWLGLLAGVIVSLGPVILMGKLFSEAFSSNYLLLALGDAAVRSAAANSLAYTIPAALVFTAISVLLAYPMIGKNKIYFAVLFLFLIAGSTMAEYLVFRSFGFINSWLGVVLFCGVSVAGAFVIRFLSRGKTEGAETFSQYLKMAAPSALIVLLISFIAIWGSNGPIIMLNEQRKYPLSILVRQVIVQKELMSNVDQTITPSQVGHSIGLISMIPSLAAGWGVIWFSGLFKPLRSRQNT